ncbi:MAG: 2-phosphosulfolactate phosphatase [Bacteroidetes bacterium]|nr:2-phosphosulfolactate phosphatase [Bacteroidota bacterium]
MKGSDLHTVEVCFSPKLFSDILTKDNFIIVLSDILRATTSVCAAFENGIKSIIPVASLDEARSLKEKGYMVASELDGKKLDFADFGNSAFGFTRDKIEGKTLVYCTTNGTRALEMAKTANTIAIGAFINITALKEWLLTKNEDVVILCSGWKNKFCLEDSLFAGALTEMLLQSGSYQSECDSAEASVDLWKAAKNDPISYIQKAAHRRRLANLGLDDVIPYSFTMDLTRVVPVFNGNEIININNLPQ